MEVHEIARITNIEAVPQRRHKPFIIYECINLSVINVHLYIVHSFSKYFWFHTFSFSF